jgi:hypothetical protein
VSATTPTPTPTPATPETPATPATPAAPAPLTAQQVQEIVAQTFRAEVNRTRAENAQIAAQQQQNQPTPTPKEAEVEAARTQKVRSFAADPDKFLDDEMNSRFDKKLEERVAPILGPVVYQTRDALLAGEQAKVDAQYGAGFYEKNIAPRLFTEDKQGAVDKLVPMHQSNAKVIAATVQGILGEFAAANPEALVTAFTARKTAEREAQAPPTSWAPGSFNPADPTSRLHPDVQEGLTRLQQTGAGFTEADYREAKTNGKSLDGWLAAAEAKKAQQRQGAR